MSDVVRVLAVIVIIGYVLGRQLRGEPLRGKRVVLLPAILTVIGVVELGGSDVPIRPVDLVCLVAGGAISLAIGVQQGRMLRLEERDGALWGQMPMRGLWLWLALIASRLVMIMIAAGLNAKVAESTASILLMLGINRLGQGVIILLHGWATGIPFAPEKDGKTFLEGFLAAPPGGTVRASSTVRAGRVANRRERRRP